MDIMLFSNGYSPGNTLPLEYGLDWIEGFAARAAVKKFVFIPYAVIRDDYDARKQMVGQSLARFGWEVSAIHRANDPVQALEEADGVLVSGGNTWVLNKTLHDLGLIRPIRNAVLKQNKLYIGWSAGSNIAAPTIRTTNDMPIVTAAVLPALNLIPFQINPHYVESLSDSQTGETRDERIEEFLLLSPHEIVVGLPEASMLRVHDGQIRYYSANDKPLKLFRNGREPEYFGPQDDIGFLLEHGC